MTQMAMTRTSLLAVLRRTMDPNWIDGILADEDGAAILNSQLDVLVAVSDATERGCNAGLISTAPGGQPGVTTLVAERDDTTQAATIPKGYKFKTNLGTSLILQDAIPVFIGQAVVALPLETVRQTDLAETVDGAFDFVTPGGFLDVAVDLTSPVVSDGVAAILGPAGTVTGTHFLTIISSDPITNAALDYLSAHGNERGQRRQAHEQTEDYRLRVRNIPDAVSPLAISTAVRNVGSRVGIDGIIVREPFEDGADATVKAEAGLSTFDSYYGSGLADPATSPKTDFVDDPFFAPSPLPVGFVPRTRETVSNREGRAYFRIETPGEISDPDGIRFFADVSFCDDPVFGYLDVRDHPAVISALMSIWEEANRKRAAAVQFDVLLPLAVEVVGSGHAVAAAPVVVVTLIPPAGKSWLLVDFVVGHDAARSGTIPVTPDFHEARFTFTDASVFTTFPFDGIVSQHLPNSALLRLGFPFDKRIAKIEGILAGAGVRDLGLVVDARVLEFTE